MSAGLSARSSVRSQEVFQLAQPEALEAVNAERAAQPAVSPTAPFDLPEAPDQQQVLVSERSQPAAPSVARSAGLSARSAAMSAGLSARSSVRSRGNSRSTGSLHGTPSRSAAFRAPSSGFATPLSDAASLSSAARRPPSQPRVQAGSVVAPPPVLEAPRREGRVRRSASCRSALGGSTASTWRTGSDDHGGLATSGSKPRHDGKVPAAAHAQPRPPAGAPSADGPAVLRGGGMSWGPAPEPPATAAPRRVTKLRPTPPTAAPPPTVEELQARVAQKAAILRELGAQQASLMKKSKPGSAKKAPAPVF